MDIVVKGIAVWRRASDDGNEGFEGEVRASGESDHCVGVLSTTRSLFVPAHSHWTRA